jgi:hypothetical protein
MEHRHNPMMLMQLMMLMQKVTHRLQQTMESTTTTTMMMMMVVVVVAIDFVANNHGRLVAQSACDLAICKPAYMRISPNFSNHFQQSSSTIICDSHCQHSFSTVIFNNHLQ